MLIRTWFTKADQQFRRVWLVSLVLPAALGAQTLPRVSGLPEDLLPELRPILKVAMDRSPQSIANAINVAQSEASRYGTDAPLWPSISGSATYGVSSAAVSSTGSSSKSSSTGFSYSLNLNQPIFQWGALKDRAEFGRIAVKIAERQYADAYRLLAGTIRSQYLYLIYKHAIVRVSQNSLKYATSTLAVEEAKFKEGTIAAADLVPPRVSFAETQLATDRAVADFAASKRIFMRLTGVTELPDEAVPFEVPAPSHSAASANEMVQAFVRDGVSATFQGQIYTMTLRQADLNYRIARTGNLPKFSLSSNYGLNFNTDVSAGSVRQTQVSSYGYGVNMSWSIFDGFSTRGSKLSALANKRSTERQYQNYVETATEAVQVSREQLEFSARALALAEQRLGFAQSGATRTADDFKAGLVSQAALDIANTNLLAANASIILSRADYLNRWADLVSQAGADPVITNLPARYVRSTK